MKIPLTVAKGIDVITQGDCIENSKPSKDEALKSRWKKQNQLGWKETEMNARQTKAKAEVIYLIWLKLRDHRWEKFPKGYRLWISTKLRANFVGQISANIWEPSGLCSTSPHLSSVPRCWHSLWDTFWLLLWTVMEDFWMDLRQTEVALGRLITCRIIRKEKN